MVLKAAARALKPVRFGTGVVLNFRRPQTYKTTSFLKPLTDRYGLFEDPNAAQCLNLALRGVVALRHRDIRHQDDLVHLIHRPLDALQVSG